ncbi:prohibitin-like protein [Plasmodium gonderi]|uniref:Prohibitin-like protein n=1 Tax=Plasmodium gonderi TaxID=77519 RepID=A0A1Y1JC23_PLAGO|nr:prohibitin-like protein [Plasmodium gonderi]GAW79790.1 prohibitin-like protein [Plasmodium gonderi]
MRRNFFFVKNYSKCKKEGNLKMRRKCYIHNLAEFINIKKVDKEKKQYFMSYNNNGINKIESQMQRRVNIPHVDFEKKNDGDNDETLYSNINMASYHNEMIQPCDEIKFGRMKSFKLLGLCLIMSLFFYCTLKKVPEGYICLVQNKKDYTVLPYIYDDLMTFFYNPLKYKVIIMRVTPIQKKFTRIYETLDKKQVRVKLQVKMKPKIPFIIEIFSSFGDNYSTNYIEREMNLDIMNVVKNYNLATLTQSSKELNKTTHDTVDDAVDQIMDRFYDCSIFHKIILLDVSILFERAE